MRLTEGSGLYRRKINDDLTKVESLGEKFKTGHECDKMRRDHFDYLLMCCYKSDFSVIKICVECEIV